MDTKSGQFFLFPILLINLDRLGKNETYNYFGVQYSVGLFCGSVAKPEIIHHDFVPNLRFLSRYGSFDDLGD